MNNSAREQEVEMLGHRAGREFSIGITAAPTAPRSTRSKTSADREQGTTDASFNILPVASWLNDPSFPLDSYLHKDGQSIAELLAVLSLGCPMAAYFAWFPYLILVISRTTIPAGSGFQWVVDRGDRD